MHNLRAGTGLETSLWMEYTKLPRLPHSAEQTRRAWRQKVSSSTCQISMTLASPTREYFSIMSSKVCLDWLSFA